MGSLIMRRIVTIANQKGGVGKTTTSINLAAALAHIRQRVLLLDCDPQANASSGLGVRPPASAPSMYQVLLNGAEAPPIVQPFPQLPLHLLPANSQLAAAEWELPGRGNPEGLLAARLAALAAAYDYLIIDCPPSLGLLTVNALVAATEVVIPIQCEYFAMEGLSLLLETVRRIKLRWNPNLQIGGILLTMFDRRNNLAHQVANDIRRHFPGQVFHTLIPRNVRLGESPSHGLPIHLYDPGCPGAEAYLALAGEFHHREDSDG